MNVKFINIFIEYVNLLPWLFFYPCLILSSADFNKISYENLLTYTFFDFSASLCFSVVAENGERKPPPMKKFKKFLSNPCNQHKIIVEIICCPDIERIARTFEESGSYDYVFVKNEHIYLDDSTMTGVIDRFTLEEGKAYLIEQLIELCNDLDNPYCLASAKAIAKAFNY